MTNNLVSVILPVYNEMETIEKAVNSILQQTYEPIELIVIDGGSTDGTAEYLSGIEQQNDNVSVINEPDHVKNISGALNIGISKSNGKYIARQDGDDYSYEQRIETQVEYIEKTNSDVVTCNVNIMAPEKDVIYSPPNNPFKELDSRNPIIHGSILCSREILIEMGGYNEGYDNSEDYELWVRMKEQGASIGVVRDVLYAHDPARHSMDYENYKERAAYSSLARSGVDASHDTTEEILSKISSHELSRFHSRVALYNVRMLNKERVKYHTLRSIYAEPLRMFNIVTIFLGILPMRVSKYVIGKIETF